MSKVGKIYIDPPELTMVSDDYEEESKNVCKAIESFTEVNETLIDGWIGETAQYYNLYYLDICKRLQIDCYQILGSSIKLANDIQERMQIDSSASDATEG